MQVAQNADVAVPNQNEVCIPIQNYISHYSQSTTKVADDDIEIINNPAIIALAKQKTEHRSYLRFLRGGAHNNPINVDDLPVLRGRRGTAKNPIDVDKLHGQ